MDDPYTHEFKFELDGNFINGEVEFNTDGKVSFKINAWSEPLPIEILNQFSELMAMLKKIYENEGDIKKISIKKKTS